MEKRELGTKATRADIIDKLYDRKYINGTQQIEVNQLGENMIDTLSTYCKDLTSEELTRDFENKLEGAKIVGSGVVRDGKIITGRAMGSATDFALEIAEALCGKEVREKLKSSIIYA